MGIILTVFGTIFIIFAITGTYVYFYPDQAAKIAWKGIQAYAPEEVKMTLEKAVEDASNFLPEHIKDLIGKDPEQLKEYTRDIPFNPIESTQVRNLGHPKKIVEFYCTNDIQCAKYFKNTFARCQINSGVCYIII